MTRGSDIPAGLADALRSWDSQSTYTIEDGRSFAMSRLRTRSGSSGLCGDIAWAVVEHLSACGIDARISDAEHPDDVGLADRTVDNNYLHEVAIAQLDGVEYLIDYTAAQFGYAEFPLVHRRSGEALQRLQSTRSVSRLQPQRERLSLS